MTKTGALEGQRWEGSEDTEVHTGGMTHGDLQRCSSGSDLDLQAHARGLSPSGKLPLC